MATIGVVHVPFYSHIEALIRLSAVLDRQGHRILAWAPEVWRDRLESFGAEFRLHDPEMPPATGFMTYAASLAALTEDAAGELADELFAEDVDLIVHDSQVPWARVAGDYLGIPRIVSHPMFPIVSPHRLKEEDEPQETEGELDAAKAKFEAHWLSIARRFGVELGDIGSVIHSAGHCDATVAFTTQEIVGDHDLGGGWHFVGPLMAPIPRKPRRARPLVYACLGTSFNTRAGVFQAIIDGLADLPLDLLVSTGDGRVTADQLGPLPANVSIEPFVDGRDVLASASVHITHGGCNSVHESLLAGVPMLCLPQAFDQFPLTTRIQQLGAGLISAEAAEDVRAGVTWLLEDDGVQKTMAELAAHLADYDGASRLADVIDEVLAA